jgi:hypothetical protein
VTDRTSVRPHVLPAEHVEHVVEHDFSDLHAHETELEGRRRRIAAAAGTAHTRSAMLRWGVGVGAVMLAAGLGLTAVVWAASLFRERPPPLVIDKPVIVDREKPVIVEKEKLVVVEPKVIEKPMLAPPAGEPERKAEEIRDRLQRDRLQAGKTVTNFTIFHQADMATLPHLAVVTGWDYETAEARTPVREFCYVENRRTGLNYRITHGSKLQLFDADMAQRVGVTAGEIAAAVPLCHWFAGVAPDNIKDAR